MAAANNIEVADRRRLPQRGDVLERRLPGNVARVWRGHMLQLDDLGHSDAGQCAELVKRFARIEDPAVREKVLVLMEDPASDTGELLSIDDLITFA